MSGARVAVALLLIAGLTACSTPPDPSTLETPVDSTQSGSATPTPDADEPPPVDPNILFTITGTLLSAGGSTAELKQVVYRPVDETESMAADLARFDDPEFSCGDWRTTIPNARFLESIVTVVDTSPPSTPWPDDMYAAVILFTGGHTVYTGSFNYFQAVCDEMAFAVLGQTRTVSLTIGESGWASHEYGFAAQPNEYAGTVGTAIENCTFEASDYALSSAAIQTWAATAQDGLGCTFGEELYTEF